jgi:malonyl-CoA O-methyltransferase
MSEGPARPVAGRLVDSAALARTTRRLRAAAVAPWLHSETARRMAERLPIIRLQPSRVLDWWSFNGASTDVLRTAYPKAVLLPLEPSVAAGALASVSPATRWWLPRRRRVPAAAPLVEEQLAPDAADLVWANMALHFAADPQRVFSLWHRVLSVDGFLMFSTLGPGTLSSLQALYAEAGWQPPFAPFVDMHDLGDMLVASGFADPVMDQEQLTLTWPSAHAAVTELRSWGGNVHPERFQGLRSPQWRERLYDRLERTAGPDGRIALSFELVYGHAFKPLPRARMAPITQVSWNDLQSMARSKNQARR